MGNNNSIINNEIDLLQTNEWLVEGDFSQIKHISEPRLNREIIFRTQKKDNFVKRIALSGYHDNSYNIRIYVKNSTNEINENICKIATFDADNNCYVCKNQNYFIEFIDTFYCRDLIPNFIIEKIINDLERNNLLITKQSMITEDFSEIMISDYPNRKIVYKTSVKNSYVKKIIITGIDNENNCIRGYCSYPSEEINENIYGIAILDTRSNYDYSYDYNCSYMCNNKNYLIEFINIFCSKNFNKNTDIMCRIHKWFIDGNFDKIIVGGMRMNRKISFISQSTDNFIKNIVLYECDDNDYRISIYVVDLTEEINEKIKRIATVGLNNNYVCKNKNYLSKFIGIFYIQGLIPYFIIEKIINILITNNIMLSDELALEQNGNDGNLSQNWLIEGDFNEFFISVSKLNREIEFKSLTKDNYINRISLLG